MKKIMKVFFGYWMGFLISLLLVNRASYDPNYPTSYDQNSLVNGSDSMVQQQFTNLIPNQQMSPMNIVSEPNSGVLNQSGIEQQWQKNSDSLYDTYTQFNWQQRKLLKQKTYKVYVNVLSIVTDIEKVVEKYKQKEKDILGLVEKLSAEMIPLCQLIDNRFLSVSDLYEYTNSIKKDIQDFQKKEYFSMNKNFRDFIETVSIEITNIYKMIDNIVQNKNDLENLKNNLLNSFQILDQVYAQSKNYENELWSTYQYLDELISDKKANEYYSMIINFSDNIIQINNFLRSDFLLFFNQSLSSLNYASTAIKNAMQNLTEYIKNVAVKRDEAKKELYVYEEEKKQLEIKKKQEEDEAIRIAEEKKRKDIAYKKKMELMKPWYLKIISDVSVFAINVIDKSILLANTTISLIINYVQSFIGLRLKNKKINISKKDLKISKNESGVSSAVVDQALAQLPVQENILPQEFTFGQNSSPTALTEISPVNNEETMSSQSISPENKILAENNSNETLLNDVFSQQPDIKPLLEKNIKGGSSYPTTVPLGGAPALPMGEPYPAVENPATQNLSITEDIPMTYEENEEPRMDQQDNATGPFHYTSLEQGDSSSQAPDSLIPDLADAANTPTRDIKTSFDVKEHATFHVDSGGKKIRSSNRTNKRKKNSKNT